MYDRQHSWHEGACIPTSGGDGDRLIPYRTVLAISKRTVFYRAATTHDTPLRNHTLLVTNTDKAGCRRRKLRITPILPTLSFAVSASVRRLRPSTWTQQTMSDTHMNNPGSWSVEYPTSTECLQHSTDCYHIDRATSRRPNLDPLHTYHAQRNQTRLEQRSHTPEECRRRNAAVLVHER